MLKSSLRTSYGGHHDLVNRYGISLDVSFAVITILISFPLS